MEWISWTDDLALGVEKIDTQHKELIKQYNKFADAVWEGKGRETIGSTLNFLAQYTVTHFKDEEALQQMFGYPGYERHKSIHDQFVSEVKNFITKFKNNEVDSDLVVKTTNAVGDWVLNHIKKEDQAIGVYINSRLGSGRSPSSSGYESQKTSTPKQEDPFSQTQIPEPQAQKGFIKRFFDWLY